MSARALLATVALLLGSAAQAQQAANPLPPGEGRELVIAACTSCHGTLPFTQMRVGPAGWRSEVYSMILRGAQVQPVDVEIIVGYLSANFGLTGHVPSVKPVTLPEGAGKPLVEQRCAFCHGLERSVGTPRKDAEWDAILARMVALGAPLSPQEIKMLSAYLRDNFGVRSAR